eukprot:PhF_6_TR40497/c0_g1_i2/m.60595
MASTWRQRYFGEPKESEVKYRIKGEVRMVQVCLNYEGTESPLGCIIDGKRLRDKAIASGVNDITSLYDDGSTPLFPCVADVKQAIRDTASRCVDGDFFVLQYSGHGTNEEDEDGDESDGQDEALCLRTRAGDDETMIDDVLTELISTSLKPGIPCLFLCDACASGTIMDTTKPGIWGGGRVVFAISGCQDNQCSGDTGDGGVMTNALLKVLDGLSGADKKKAAQGQLSIQWIFNRMVDIVDEDDGDDEEDEEEGEEDEEEEGEEEEDEEDEEEIQDADIDPITGEEVAPGQTLNLSWVGRGDPRLYPFPLFGIAKKNAKGKKN